MIYFNACTLLTSKNAAENGQLLALALVSRVDSKNIASAVLLPFRNPYCSGPNMLLSSAMDVMCLHILAVMSLRMLDGTVRGLYWEGWRESPPWI